MKSLLSLKKLIKQPLFVAGIAMSFMTGAFADQKLDVLSYHKHLLPSYFPKYLSDSVVKKSSRTLSVQPEYKGLFIKPDMSSPDVVSASRLVRADTLEIHGSAIVHLVASPKAVVSKQHVYPISLKTSAKVDLLEDKIVVSSNEEDAKNSAVAVLTLPMNAIKHIKVYDNASVVAQSAGTWNLDSIEYYSNATSALLGVIKLKDIYQTSGRLLSYWIDSSWLNLEQAGGVLELSGIADNSSVRLSGNATFLASQLRSNFVWFASLDQSHGLIQPRKGVFGAALNDSQFYRTRLNVSRNIASIDSSTSLTIPNVWDNQKFLCNNYPDICANY